MLGVLVCSNIVRTLARGGVEGGCGGSGAIGGLGGGNVCSKHARVQFGIQSAGACATQSVRVAVMSVRRWRRCGVGQKKPVSKVRGARLAWVFA